MYRVYEQRMTLMTRTDTQPSQIEEMAGEVFDLAKLVWMSGGTQHHKDEYDLSEPEFLTLDLLTKADSMTVGELQRGIGVLPAQMSRLIRSLERKDGEPLVTCSLNPDDKRKIDVTITEVGRKAHKSYQAAKLAVTMAVLTEMQDADRRELLRIVRTIKSKIANPLVHN